MKINIFRIATALLVTIGFVAANIRVTEIDRSEWTVFNKTSVGRIYGRGWPFFYQRIFEIKSANTFETEKLAKLRNTSTKGKKLGITSVPSLTGNVLLVCLVVLFVLGVPLEHRVMDDR